MAKTRGGKPRGSVAWMPLDRMLAAVTGEDKSNADVQAEVGMSDADEKVLHCALQATQPNETDTGERKP